MINNVPLFENGSTPEKDRPQRGLRPWEIYAIWAIGIFLAVYFFMDFGSHCGLMKRAPWMDWQKPEHVVQLNKNGEIEIRKSATKEELRNALSSIAGELVALKKAVDEFNAKQQQQNQPKPQQPEEVKK